MTGKTFTTIHHQFPLFLLLQQPLLHPPIKHTLLTLQSPNNAANRLVKCRWHFPRHTEIFHFRSQN